MATKEKLKEGVGTDVANVPENKGALAEIVTRPGTTSIAIARPDAVDIYDDMASDDNGLSNVAAHERRLPILRILDPKSPQCKPIARGGIPGAKGGTIFNTSTGQIYDGERGLFMIPCYRDEKYVRYIKREDDGSGGGFLAVLEPEDPVVERRKAERMKEFGNLFGKLKDGTTDDGKDVELVQTFYLYSIMCIADEQGAFAGEFSEFFPALVPYSSTNIPIYNSYIERCKNFRYNIRGADQVIRPQVANMWSHVWQLTTQFHERGAQSWYKWQMGLAGRDSETKLELNYKHSRLPNNNPLYLAAEELRTMALEGNARVDYEKDAPASGEAQAGRDSGGAGEDIPFGDDR